MGKRRYAQEVVKKAATAIAKLEPSSGDPFIDMIERAARDPNVDVGKLEHLLNLKTAEQRRLAEDMFNTAMAAAQGEMVAVKRDLSNPHTRSRYASYEALDNAARPIYSRHGFALSFGTEAIPPLMKINGDTATQVDQGGLLVYCDVVRGGFSRRYSIPMPITTKGPRGQDVMTPIHATGSAATYGRRYLLLMIFNIVLTDSDDDGNRAGGNNGNGGPIDAAQLAELNALLEQSRQSTSRPFATIWVWLIWKLCRVSKFKYALSELQSKRKAIAG